MLYFKINKTIHVPFPGIGKDSQRAGTTYERSGLTSQCAHLTFWVSTLNTCKALQDFRVSRLGHCAFVVFFCDCVCVHVCLSACAFVHAHVHTFVHAHDSTLSGIQDQPWLHSKLKVILGYRETLSHSKGLSRVELCVHSEGMVGHHQLSQNKGTAL